MNDRTARDVGIGIQELQEQAQRLGLMWSLRPGTVARRGSTNVNAASIVNVIYDGDTRPISMISMIGPMVPGDRVWCVHVPPAGDYIVGYQQQAIGYRLNSIIYHDIAGAIGLEFLKSDHPSLRAVRVKCQAGGGGSGGVEATAAGEAAVSGGGAGGNYAESFILVEDIPDVVSITVGDGGNGGAAGGANDGSDGDPTSFGSLVIATGGSGGNGSPGGTSSSSTTGSSGGINSTAGLVGDLVIQGADGIDGRKSSGVRTTDAKGGDSQLGTGRSESNVTASADGIDGFAYGGGASGAHSQSNSSSAAGGKGGPGILIIELFV